MQATFNAGTTSNLARFGRNLSELAAAAKLEPLIGRKEELRKLIQTLNRRIKPNPVLLGPPGIGKTAIVEGLAQALVSPENASEDLQPALSRLQGCSIIELSMMSLVSGAGVIGQFEERMEYIIRELEGSQGKIICFIDEIHMLLGAGGRMGLGDAANLLKPALARGAFPLIGATTSAEYQLYIAQDAALERRFSPLYIDEPSRVETSLILEKLLPQVRNHYGVTIAPGLINEVIVLAEHFLPGRHYPDKAIELLDQSASRAIMEPAPRFALYPGELVKTLPEETVTQVKEKAQEGCGIERVTLTADVAKPSNLELHYILETFLQGQLHKVQASSSSPVNGKSLVQSQPKRLFAQADLIELRREHLLEGAADLIGLREGLVAWPETDLAIDLEKRLSQTELGSSFGNLKKGLASFLATRFSGEARWNRGVRAVILLTGLSGKALGQVAAGLSEAIFSPKMDDLAESFISGGRYLHDFDLAQYAEEHSISGLVGTSPGYIGYEQGGKLLNRLLGRPGGLLLLRNADLAHPSIREVLAESFSSGHLIDGRGRAASLRQVVVLVTLQAKDGRTERVARDQGKSLGFKLTTEKNTKVGGNGSPKLVDPRDINMYADSISGVIDLVLEFPCNWTPRSVGYPGPG